MREVTLMKYYFFDWIKENENLSACVPVATNYFSNQLFFKYVYIVSQRAKKENHEYGVFFLTHTERELHNQLVNNLVTIRVSSPLDIFKREL
jgi:hypothetical protein